MKLLVVAGGLVLAAVVAVSTSFSSAAGQGPDTVVALSMAQARQGGLDPASACTSGAAQALTNASTAGGTAASGAAVAAQAAWNAGWRGPDLTMAVAIAGAESGFDPTAFNPAAGGNYGEWQINSVHAALLASGDWRDPQANARMGYQVWEDAGGSWRPWETYTNGAFQRYASQAGVAVQQLDVAVTQVSVSAWQAPDPCQDASLSTADAVGESSQAAAAIAAARTRLGIPYLWGGTGGDDGLGGFDCSGLTQWAYAQVGIQIPRTSRQQYAALPKVSLDALQPGDLVFYAFGTDPTYIDHVALYIGGGQVIHAPHTGTVIKVAGVKMPGLFGAVRPTAH